MRLELLILEVVWQAALCSPPSSRTPAPLTHCAFAPATPSLSPPQLAGHMAGYAAQSRRCSPHTPKTSHPFTVPLGCSDLSAPQLARLLGALAALRYSPGPAWLGGVLDALLARQVGRGRWEAEKDCP